MDYDSCPCEYFIIDQLSLWYKICEVPDASWKGFCDVKNIFYELTLIRIRNGARVWPWPCVVIGTLCN